MICNGISRLTAQHCKERFSSDIVRVGATAYSSSVRDNRGTCFPGGITGAAITLYSRVHGSVQRRGGDLDFFALHLLEQRQGLLPHVRLATSIDCRVESIPVRLPKRNARGGARLRTTHTCYASKDLPAQL